MGLNSAVTDVRWSGNFSGGRPAGDPSVIVIHHWGVDGQSHQGVVDYLCRPGGDTSAHYVVSAGRVTQLVHDYDRAWHAGPSGNPRGIGVECRPEMSAADFETVAGLVAAIRDEWGPLPLRGHREFMATACPGRWQAQLGRLSARADQLRGKPAPTPAPTGPLSVDGFWGAATTRALQQINRLPVSGRVVGQDPAWRRVNPGLTGGWEWSGPTGSDLVRTIQKAWGAPADGLIGPATIRAMQKYYGTPVDGVLDEASPAIMALQTALNTQLGGK